MKNLVSLLVGVLFLLPAISQRLDVVTFPSSEKSGSVNCYILTSGKQSILVNAPMSARDARRLTDTVTRLNRHLVGVFISGARPEYYLGVAEIIKVFPLIKVMSTHDVAVEIAKSGPGMYDHYRSRLDADRPAPLILPDSIVENSINLENCHLELHSIGSESNFQSILYEPKQRILFPGDIVNNKIHPDLAEHPAETMLKELEELKKYSAYELFPVYGPSSGGGGIENCINYLQTFKRALMTNDSLAVFDIMNYYFPGYSMPGVLKRSIAKNIGVTQ